MLFLDLLLKVLQSAEQTDTAVASPFQRDFSEEYFRLFAELVEKAERSQDSAHKAEEPHSARARKRRRGEGKEEKEREIKQDTEEDKEDKDPKEHKITSEQKEKEVKIDPTVATTVTESGTAKAALVPFDKSVRHYLISKDILTILSRLLNREIQRLCNNFCCLLLLLLSSMLFRGLTTI